MTPAEIREEIIDILGDIAPDEDLERAGRQRNHSAIKSNWIAWTFLGYRHGTPQASSRSDSGRGLRPTRQHGQHGDVSWNPRCAICSE